MKIALRKAYKISCELSGKISSGSSCLNITGKYNVYDQLGPLSVVVNSLHEKQEQEFSSNLEALVFVNALRLRIQEANNLPLSYADGLSINQLIAKQATLNAMIKFIPTDVSVLDHTQLNSTISTQLRRLEDKENLARFPSSYQTPEVVIGGIRETFDKKVSDERMSLRSELESVTSKLAYANITETVELSDKEAEILRNFKVPV